MKKLNSAEAVLGFLAWLTCREQEVTFSSKQNASIAVELFEKFQRVNNLPNVREDYYKILKHPKE